ncbi:MAG: carbohydrate ABC transporter permease [Thermomicrobiales bacterium]
MAQSLSEPRSLDDKDLDFVSPTAMETPGSRIVGFAWAALRYLLLIFYAVVCLYPFAWMVATSLRTARGTFKAGFSLWVTDPQWSNYTDIWHAANIPRAIVNTVVITAVCMALTILTTSMTAYALSRSDFPGRKFVLVALLTTLLVPGEMLIIPTYYVNRTFGLVGDGRALIAVILVMTAGAQVFNIYLLLGHFATIPKDLFESAELDGETYVGAYWRIAFPLIRPALATITLLTFMGIWNAYLIPLVYLAPLKDFQTLTIALIQYSKRFQTLYHIMAAGGVIAVIPIMILFVFLQRYFIRGLTEGATKG